LRSIVQTLFRWFPFPAEPGLRTFGNPDEHAPVFVTGNFDLTVARVARSLEGLDCYLLVARSGGINVWCAARGGRLDARSVADAVKVARLDGVVEHRTLILPQLAAAGVDAGEVRRRTGWAVEFGPVYARDIQEYLARERRKMERMRAVEFPLRDRLEMAVALGFPIYLAGAVPIAVWWRAALVQATALFWALALFAFAAYPRLPGRSGTTKAVVAGLTFAIAIGAWSWFAGGSFFASWGWMAGALAISAVIGGDLPGMTPLEKSALESLARRLGLRSFFGLFPLDEGGEVEMDADRCTGCGACVDVCPRGVYAMDEAASPARVARPERCVDCGSCVVQCPVGCIQRRRVERGSL